MSNKKQTKLDRFERKAMLGGGLGALQGLGIGGILPSAATGAAAGGLQGLISDSMFGVPEEHGFGDEFKHGMKGGAVTGAAMGPVALGAMNKITPLVQFLMKRGMGKGAALATVLGGGALAGSAVSSIPEGLHNALVNTDYSK